MNALCGYVEMSGVISDGREKNFNHSLCVGCMLLLGFSLYSAYRTNDAYGDGDFGLFYWCGVWLEYDQYDLAEYHGYGGHRFMHWHGQYGIHDLW